MLKPHLVVDGLVIALDMLNGHCKKLKYEKKIYMFTSASRAIDLDGVDQIKAQIAEMGVTVYLVYAFLSMKY